MPINLAIPGAYINDVNRVNNFISKINTNFEKIKFDPFLKEMAEEISELHQEYFEKQESPQGNKWVHWFFTSMGASPSHPTLVVTGRLKSSMALGGPENISNVSNGELTFGTSVSYAGVLNDGGETYVTEPLVSIDGMAYLAPGDKINIPKREFIGLSENFVDSMMERLADYVMQGLLKHAPESN